MANRDVKHLLKRSNVNAKVPSLADLSRGELALNTADAKAYTIYTSGTTNDLEVRQLGWDRLSTETGGTVNGNVTIKDTLFTDIVSGDTQDTVYYGDGSNLKNISTSDTYVTGATLTDNNQKLNLERNDGNTVSVTGFNPTHYITYNANDIFPDEANSEAARLYLVNTTITFIKFDSAANTVSRAGFTFNTEEFRFHGGTPAQMNVWYTMNGNETATAPLILNFTTASTQTTSYFDNIHLSATTTISGYTGTAWKSLNTGFFDFPHDILHKSDIVNIQLKRNPDRADDNLNANYYISTIEIKH